MNNWKETTLGDTAEIVTDYVANGSFAALKKNVTYKNKNDFARLIRLKDENNSYAEKDAVYVSKKSYEFLKKSKLYPGDIVISNVGEYSGTVFRVPDLGKPMTLGPNSILVRFKENEDFMFYLLSSRIGQFLINSIKSGSANPKFNKTDFKKIKINLPFLPEQKQIAAVLSSLDDKIDLLRKENGTLEKIAQTIFKEWFVDFTIDGKKLKLKNGIPEGWRVGRLGDVLSLEYGKALKESSRSGKGYPVLGSGGVVGYHDEFLVEGDGIVVGRKGTMGSITWVESSFYPIDTAFYVKDRLGIEKLYYHYLLLLRQDFEKVGSDSAVPGLNRNSAYSIATVVPKIEIVEKFSETISPIFAKIKLNNYQIQTLSCLRDTLLPKLMSGAKVK